MQAPLHMVSGDEQLLAQLPTEQTCPPEQLVPHAPQLCGSRKVSTHVVPHMVWPAGQTQLPNEQTAPPLHAGAHAGVITGVVGTPPVPPPSRGTASIDPQPA